MTTRLGGNSSPANHHARKAEEKVLGEGEEREEGEEEGKEKETEEAASKRGEGEGKEDILASLTHTHAPFSSTQVRTRKPTHETYECTCICTSKNKKQAR